MTTSDPYVALNLPHTATTDEIKKSYRNFAKRWHPDRLIGQQLSLEQQREATKTFAQLSEAYAILSDARKKAEYDHIYKFGGFDPDPVVCDETKSHAQDNSNSIPPSRKRKSSTGIGYTCAVDPFAYLCTNGRIRTKMAVCGLSLPTRSATGLQFAFSSAEVQRCAGGTRRYVSHTTQFCNGQTTTRKETTTVFPDGHKEVCVEGQGGSCERYQVPADHLTTQVSQEELPWYATAWMELKDKLTMCYSPCSVVAN
jgi:curved DNA-binding protein CbpA